MNFRYLSILILGILCNVTISLANPPANPPEDFVRAYVMIAGPGEAVYSATGHAFFRMQCDEFDKDYCFTYESEPVTNRVLTFLSGNLKMGMMAEPTDKFVEMYKSEGRDVTGYELQLPIKVKQNLWRILDNLTEQGMTLPYSYTDRGCSQSVLDILNEALGTRQLSYGEWPAEFEKSRRELLSDELINDPWKRVAIHVMTNGSANDEVPYQQKGITPKNLLSILKIASLDGKPIISQEPVVFAKRTREDKPVSVSPVGIAVILLVLTLICIWFRKPYMMWCLLALQTLLGLLNVYLIFVSSLCATEWSWLIIPFNPLPLLLWKWRRYWEIPYTVVITIWSVAMICMPPLTDPSLIILAITIAIAFVDDRIGLRSYFIRKFNQK
ncbi:MAG: DUF4105 domain-containing protein [Muribaculum sp.]|nr:DUF4105 domain-containing protein [Muribaculum sp.]